MNATVRSLFRLLATGVAAILLCAAGARGGSERRAEGAIEPWWQTNSPGARAQERLSRLHTEFTPREIKAQYQVFTVSPVAGKTNSTPVTILDIFSIADVYHFSPTNRFQGGLYITYEVTNPVNAVLHTDSGSAFWEYENNTTLRQTVFYSSERWNLQKAGVFATPAQFFSWTSYTGDPMAKGVFLLSRHCYFQVYDAISNKYLTAFDAPIYGRAASFTAANLTRYDLRIGEIASDWSKGGYVGAEVLITDADGDTFDVPNAEVWAYISSGASHETHRIRLANRRWRYDSGKMEERNKFFGQYPEGFFDARLIEVKASVYLLGPDGAIRREEISKQVAREESKPVAMAAWQNIRRRPDLRTKEGKLIETRSLWAHPNYATWWESVDQARKALATAQTMHVNVIEFVIYCGGQSYIQSGLMPSLAPTNEDVFTWLIDEAHKSGAAVIPGVTCMLGGSTFRGYSNVLAQHPEWRNSADGKVCDVHRPEFRKHFIAYIADVARRYRVDGITLDYTRAVEMCHCKKCAEEYRQKYGRDIVKDSAHPPYAIEFQEWQNEAVGELVQGIRAALDAVRPGLWLAHWGTGNSGQGRRPDVWLDNGWIDWFEVCCYGNDPGFDPHNWLVNAKTVKRPECVFPSFGLYQGGPSVSVATETVMPLTNTVTGNRITGASARRAAAIRPVYEACRDQCQVYGFDLFDLSYVTAETAKEIGEQVFSEPAVPWFPQKNR